MPDLEDALAYNLRRLRTARGWTQEELAHRVDLSARYIGKIERSQVSATLKVVGRLSDAFGIAPSELIIR